MKKKIFVQALACGRKQKFLADFMSPVKKKVYFPADKIFHDSPEISAFKVCSPSEYSSGFMVT